MQRRSRHLEGGLPGKGKSTDRHSAWGKAAASEVSKAHPDPKNPQYLEGKICN